MMQLQSLYVLKTGEGLLGKAMFLLSQMIEWKKEKL